jgi:hypothetical protein
MFAAMPIGDYTVTAILEGFQKQAAEGVRVAIGAVATVDFTMPDAFSEEITVIGETPIVDVASPTFNTRFDDKQIIDLPTRGHFYDMIAMTPGVTQIDEGSSAISAFGADVKSSQWNIDGLNRTAPEGGDLSWSMNDELVAEIQVLGTGATAEYGGMLGTAFNVVTKSGTNEFHGSANLDYWNPDWVGENGRREDAPEGAQTYRLDHHNALQTALGGPIVKDMMWFFVGAEWGRFQAFYPFEAELPEQKESYWNNYDAKLTAQLAQNHRLNLTYTPAAFIRNRRPGRSSIRATIWWPWTTARSSVRTPFSRPAAVCGGATTHSAPSMRATSPSSPITRCGRRRTSAAPIGTGTGSSTRTAARSSSPSTRTISSKVTTSSDSGFSTPEVAGRPNRIIPIGTTRLSTSTTRDIHTSTSIGTRGCPITTVATPSRLVP